MKKNLAPILLLILSMSSFAQDGITKKVVNAKGEINYLKFDPAVKKYSMSEFEIEMKKILELEEFDELHTSFIF